MANAQGIVSLLNKEAHMNILRLRWDDGEMLLVPGKLNVYKMLN
jgi:hypothetical protein